MKRAYSEEWCKKVYYTGRYNKHTKQYGYKITDPECGRQIEAAKMFLASRGSIIGYDPMGCIVSQDRGLISLKKK